MAAGSSAKGNPASHRMSNANLKARRQKSWARGQQVHEANRKAQAEREQLNSARGYTTRELRRAIAWSEGRLYVPMAGDTNSHLNVLELAKARGEWRESA